MFLTRKQFLSDQWSLRKKKKIQKIGEESEQIEIEVESLSGADR